MKNALRITAISLLVVATLAGCFKGKVELTVNENNTIDGQMLIAVQAGIGDSLGMSDDELLDQMTSDTSEDFEGATVTDYNEDGYIGKVTTFTNQPLDTFKGETDGSDISITREGDTFVVDGTWSTEDADTEGMDPATMGAEFTFSMTFPGAVTESNGTVSEDGKTVTWDLLDPPDTIHAEANATGGSSFPVLLIVLIVVGIAVIAAVITTLLVLRKRGRRTAAVAAPIEAGAPVEFTAPVPATDAPLAADAAQVGTPTAPPEVAAPENPATP